MFSVYFIHYHRSDDSQNKNNVKEAENNIFYYIHICISINRCASAKCLRMSNITPTTLP